MTLLHGYLASFVAGFNTLLDGVKVSSMGFYCTVVNDTSERLVQTQVYVKDFFQREAGIVVAEVDIRIHLEWAFDTGNIQIPK